jgi:hypothetical protein
MDKTKFAGKIKMIVPLIIDRYRVLKILPYDIAINHLYNSRLYEALEDEETSLWHLSPLLLCELLIEEMETGKITWPEEQ